MTNSIIPIATMTLDAIQRKCGEENMGGMTIQGYLALRCEVQTWPTAKSPIVKIGDLVKLQGNYAMKEGKFFIPIEGIIETPKTGAESQGESESKSFKQKSEFKIAGATKAETGGWMRLLNNVYAVIIWIDNNGNRVQIGDNLHPAVITPTSDTGENPTNRSEATFVCEANNFRPFYLYEGSIPLSEGGSVPPIES